MQPIPCHKWRFVTDWLLSQSIFAQTFVQFVFAAPMPDRNELSEKNLRSRLPRNLDDSLPPDQIRAVKSVPNYFINAQL
jgi:hypothetical protein